MRYIRQISVNDDLDARWNNADFPLLSFDQSDLSNCPSAKAISCVIIEFFEGQSEKNVKMVKLVPLTKSSQSAVN